MAPIGLKTCGICNALIYIEDELSHLKNVHKFIITSSDPSEVIRNVLASYKSVSEATGANAPVGSVCAVINKPASVIGGLEAKASGSNTDENQLADELIKPKNGGRVQSPTTHPLPSDNGINTNNKVIMLLYQ